MSQGIDQFNAASINKTRGCTPCSQTFDDTCIGGLFDLDAAGGRVGEGLGIQHQSPCALALDEAVVDERFRQS